MTTKHNKKYWDWLNNLILIVTITFAIYLIIQNFIIPYFKKPQPISKEDIANIKKSYLLSSNKYNIKIYKTPYLGYGQDFRKGKDNAPIKIVIFSDFQCPACKMMFIAIEELIRQYNKEEILIVYKNFPLDKNCNHNLTRNMHVYACKIAMLARCAGNKGYFWEFYNQIYQNQHNINNSFIKDIAQKYGKLSEQEIMECLNNQDILNKIKEDILEADKLNISEIPTIFINGKKYLGSPYVEYLIKAIEEIKYMN